MIDIIQRVPWTVQPQSPVGINRTHPVGEAVLAYFNAGESLRFGNNSPTTIGGTPSVGVAGSCVDYAATKTQYPFDASIANGLANASGCAVLVVCDVDALTNYGGIFSSQNTYLTGGALELRLGISSTDSKIYMLRCASGGLFRDYATSSNRIAAGDKNVRLLVSFPNNNVQSAPTVYVNGVAYSAPDVGSSSGTGNVLAATSSGICLGGRSADTATQLDGRIYNVWLIGRGVTEAEGIDLTRTPSSPYALFVPQTRRIWVPSIDIPSSIANATAKSKPWIMKPPAGQARLKQGHQLNQGLVGWWLMNEGGGLKAYDISGQGNHGTLTNNPTWTIGKRGPALGFDGTNRYVNTGITSNTNFSNTTFSGSVWFKTTASTGMLLAKQDITGGSAGGWAVSFGAAQVINVVHKDATGANVLTRFTTNTGLNDGKWHHIVFTMTTNTSSSSGQNINIYLDGVLNQGSLTNTAAVVAVAWPVYFGNRYNTSIPWDGSIDDVRIYMRALSTSEIQSLYYNPLAALEPQTRRIWAPGIDIPSSIANATAKPKPWTVQPQSPVAINRAHPVGKDVLAYFNAGESLRFGRDFPTTIGGTPSVGAAGRCIDYPGNTKTQYPFDARIANGMITAAGCATLMVFDVDTLTNYGALFSCEETSTARMPLELRVGNTATDSKIASFRGISGGTSPSRFAMGSNQITAGDKRIRLLVSFPDNNVVSVPTYYLNGAVLNPTKLGGSDINNVAAPVSVGVCLGGRSSDTVTPFDGRIYNVWLIGRGVTEAEGIDLTRTPSSPYALFVPQKQQIQLPRTLVVEPPSAPTPVSGDTTETMSLSDTISGIVTYLGGIIESINLTEIVSALKDMIGSIAETLGFSDSSSTGSSQSDSTTESISLTSAESSSAALGASSTESVSLVSTENTLVSLGGSSTESVSLVSTESASAALGGSSTESLSLVDASNSGALQSGASTESVSLVSTENAAAALSGSSTESVSLVSAESVSAALGGSSTESISLVSAEGVALATAGSSTESVSLVDTPAINSTAGATTETIALTDSVSTIATLIASITETTTLSEVVTGLASIPAGAVESISLVESAVAQRVIDAIGTESIALSDITTAAGALIANIVSAISLSEINAANISAYSIIIEQVTLSDTTGGNAPQTWSVSCSETLTLSDIAYFVSTLTGSPNFIVKLPTKTRVIKHPGFRTVRRQT